MVDHIVRFIHDTMFVPVQLFGSQLKCKAFRPGAPTLQREVHGQVLSASVFWAAPAWCPGPLWVGHGQAVERLKISPLDFLLGAWFVGGLQLFPCGKCPCLEGMEQLYQ